MKETMTIPTPSYIALTEGAALYLPADAGLLRVADNDRADFLHRMTTNEINKLQPGQATVTVLTSPTARINYVFTVICRQDELWLLPSPGEAATLERYLRGQIFFMDKVNVTNLSDAYRRLRVMGPEAATALTNAGFSVEALTDGLWTEAAGDAEASPVLLKQLAYGVPGFEVIVPSAQLATVQEALHAAGVTPIDEATYETHRLELGRPAAGHELINAYNPLETGLGWVCADNKGCYTGQEIIARQVTYDKITKSLVGLRSATPLPVGSELKVGGRTVGTVTSSGFSPRLQSPIALAIVKRPHHEVGTELSAGEAGALVATLPFVD